MKDRQKTSPEEEAHETPAWIVSFTDMITLLLAFFIMLQTLAALRDPEMFHMGRDSFNRAIAGLGIPDWLFGKPDGPRFDYTKRKYTSREDRHELPRNRVIDEEDARIRGAFAELREQTRTRASDVTAGLADKRIAPITFAPGTANLRKSAKDYLSHLAINLKQNLPAQTPVTVYVIGLGPDGETERSQWSLSARRGKRVQSFLEKSCADEVVTGRLRFLSWGIGPGDKWQGKIGRIPDTSHVVVVITEEGR
jgi:flagellar motor protein MotB